MNLKKRFWTTVDIRTATGGFSIFLDERQLKTPQKASLVLPTRAYAEGIAQEWDSVGEDINPLIMHLTRAANATIDSVMPAHADVADMLAEYGGTDLVCYRADSPVELVARQTRAWDPILAWSAVKGVDLKTATGVMFVPQPRESLKVLSKMVHDCDAWELTVLHDLVTISGSLLIGLAVMEQYLTAEEAWPISRVDELWQEEQWGEDDEATSLSLRKKNDFLRAEKILKLLQDV